MGGTEIDCRIDELVKSPVSETGNIAGSKPAPATILQDSLKVERAALDRLIKVRVLFLEPKHNGAIM